MDKSRFKNLKMPVPIPLGDGVNPPAEKLPEPIWINLSQKEMDALFYYDRKNHQYLDAEEWKKRGLDK